jgi:hypothetical protein
MLLSKGSVKLRSLFLSSFVLAMTTGLAGAASTGCFFIGHDDDDHHDWDDDDVAPPTDPVTPPAEELLTEVAIQPDRTLEAAPGEGVGIFVEYYSGGKWRIWTTCDTFSSKQVCKFQILASTVRTEHLRTYATEDVEGFDEVQDLGGGMVQLIADTDSDTDTLVLEVEDGQPLEVEVYIDGQSAQPFVYWVSDDLIHAGAPDNPVRFLPAIVPAGG